MDVTDEVLTGPSTQLVACEPPVHDHEVSREASAMSSQQQQPSPVWRNDPYPLYPLIPFLITLAWCIVFLIDSLERTPLVKFDLFVVPSGLLLTIVILLLGVPFMVWADYNHLSSLQNEVEATWNLVLVEMKRRGRLLPQLMLVVNTFLEHERGTLEAVVRARRQLDEASTSPEKIAAYQELAGAWSRVLFVVESYPQLTAQPSVQSLHEEVVTSANRISSAEQQYNRITQVYNTVVDRFPTMHIAKQFKFEKYSYV